MNILFNFLLLIAGFVLLIKGADIFIDSASKIAAKLKVPPILIGLTIVAFGTSAPEFAVSVKSLLSNNGDILLGNVIGSNILNITLILGLSAMFGQLRVRTNTVRKEIPILLMITLSFTVLILDHILNGSGPNNFVRQDGIVLTIIFGIFIYYLISMAKKDSIIKSQNSQLSHDSNSTITTKSSSSSIEFIKLIVWTLLGIAGIVIGSNLVVDSASYIAGSIGISQKMIALTIVALGTSLPELVTSVIATRKGQTDIAIGNVIGSNIFNLAVVAGLPVAIFGGIPQVSFSYVDLAAMVFAALLLFIFVKNDRKINKAEGVAFLALFAVYYSYVIITGVGIL